MSPFTGSSDRADVRIEWDARLAIASFGSFARPKGHLPFGTIHSHADYSAYSSAVDCDDERFGDGLHVVFGHFGSATLSRSVGFAASGRRFVVEPEHVLPPCEVPSILARADWMARATFEETHYPAYGSGATYGAESTHAFDDHSVPVIVEPERDGWGSDRHEA